MQKLFILKSPLISAPEDFKVAKIGLKVIKKKSHKKL